MRNTNNGIPVRAGTILWPRVGQSEHSPLHVTMFQEWGENLCNHFGKTMFVEVLLDAQVVTALLGTPHTE